jgi:6-pyruvoyltetrahydropterin/6-carboxytetrahydropterin synthase
MYELLIEAEFSAAHKLREYHGACENLHGHNWRVELVVAGETLGPLGMLMDFRDLKGLLREVLGRYDHVFLNDLQDFQSQNPTTENLARLIFERCAERFPEGVVVRSVAVWESAKAGARYSPPGGRAQ